MRRLVHQIGHELGHAVRRPLSLVLALAAPCALLAIVMTVASAAGAATVTAFAAALAMALAAYMGPAVSVTARREHHLLRRYAGTPLEPRTFVAARLVVAAILAVLAAVAVMATGILAYGLTLTREGAAAAAAGLVLGALCFAALGLLVSAVARRTETAHAIVFWSFVVALAVTICARAPALVAPRWLAPLSELLPLDPVISLVAAGFETSPLATMMPLAVIAGWGLVATILALVLFGWGDGRAARRSS